MDLRATGILLCRTGKLIDQPGREQLVSLINVGVALRGSDQKGDGDHGIGLVRLCRCAHDRAREGDGVVCVYAFVVVADAQPDCPAREF